MSQNEGNATLNDDNDDNEDNDAKLSEIFENDEIEYKVYDLNNKGDRKLFGDSLVKHSFALIKMPNKYQSSFYELFDIFEKLFKSKQSLNCNHSAKYIGYSSTKNVKQSLWFYLNNKNNSLFPSLENKNKSILYEANNYKKVINAYNNYNDIANDAIHAILESNCKDKESYINCWNNLFPVNNNKEYKEYEECAVYHKYRKLYDLNLNNFAAIHYYGNNEEIDDIKDKTNNNTPCGLHIDYSIITLIMANESGLTVFDKMKLRYIDIEDIINSNKMNGKDVIVIISGLTLALLTDIDNEFEPTPCQHLVKKTYKSDRISFPLFCYANPNGIIDTSFIKNTKNQQKVNIATYLAKEMRGSVNF